MVAGKMLKSQAEARGLEELFSYPAKDSRLLRINGRIPPGQYSRWRGCDRKALAVKCLINFDVVLVALVKQPSHTCDGR